MPDLIAMQTGAGTFYLHRPSPQLLTAADLTFDGVFSLPTSVPGVGGAFTSTDFAEAPIALRRVGSEVRIFSTVHNYSGGRVYEVIVPTTLEDTDDDPASFPIATVHNAWGDIYSDKKWTDLSGDGIPDDTKITYGLFWDEKDKRLYWTYGEYYDDDADSPNFGYSTLNDGTGVATGVAAFRMTSINNRRTRTGLLRMPDWFVNQYTPGKPLAIGFGSGNVALVAGASIGPALYAAKVTQPGTDTHLDSIPATEMLAYPQQSGAGYDPPLRARRDNDYQGAVWGTATAGSSNSITLDASAYDTTWLNGRDITIYEGTGAGQTRNIVSNTGLQQIVSPDWTTPPDATSKYEVPSYDGNDVWEPQGAVGYWTYGCGMRSGVCWIGTGTKQGIIMLNTLATGRQFYGPGGPRYQGFKHEFMIYNPADLAKVIRGEETNYVVEPAARWFPTFLGCPPNVPNGGMCFDSVARKLYVCINKVRSSGFENHPCIYRYSVAG